MTVNPVQMLCSSTVNIPLPYFDDAKSCSRLITLFINSYKKIPTIQNLYFYDKADKHHSAVISSFGFMLMEIFGVIFLPRN